MIRYTHYTTPEGTGMVSETDSGVLEVLYPKASAEKAPVFWKEGIGVEFVESPGLEAAVQLEEYFTGKRTEFDLKLDLQGLTPFQRDVLLACAAIPFGETSSYAELARQVGKPGAARAVGQVMARNPIPVIIPCHRVLTSDGKLGGYGGGLPLKRKLLKFEGISVRE